jgi:beta-galactosidase
MVDRAVTLGPRGLVVGGEELPLLSGALHYFRVARRRWRACLEAVKRLGFPMVESYVPWGIHELRAGRFDFTGPRDLGAFLDEAAAVGLRVLLRPGPHINAELAWFGLPERILSDERMQARTARGTPAVLLVPPRGFPVPSYASRAFLDEVRAWYRAVGEVVAPRLFPAGPVVALQVDNEHAHFFRSGAFDGDYHEEALAAWREQSGGAEPPRRLDASAPENLAAPLAWLAFRERQTVAALATLGQFLDEAGLGGVPRYHNFPPTEPGVYDVVAAERAVDFAGIDLYHGKRQYEVVRRRALYLAGSSRLPYVPELGVGSFFWGPPFSDEDSLRQILNALMHGVAGYNAYMLVERDRWYGSPVGAEGEVRPGLADRLARIHGAIASKTWSELQRRADVGVIVPRSYGRLALAASHLGPIGPAFGEWMGLDGAAMVREGRLGLDGPVQLEQVQWRTAVLAALDRTHAPYVILDGSATQEMLARRRALIVPTFDFLEADLAAKLRAFVDGGGRLLSGPRAPRLDEAMRPCDAALPGERLPPTALDDPAALSAAVAHLLAGAHLERRVAAREPNVDVTLHERADGSPALLFVGTRSDRPITAAVVLDRALTVEDVCDGATFSGDAPEIPLPPFGVRMLRVV